MSKPAERAKEERERQKRRRQEAKRKARKGARQNGLHQPFPQRSVRKRFLIVCEGAKTEPFYFRCFRIAGTVKVVGAGCNTTAVVREARKVVEEEGAFDETWCVFDRDSFPAQNFNQAIADASSHGFNVAYSNEAFELWYVLHYQYLDAGVSRDRYKEMLTKVLGREYKKNDEMMYTTLLSRREDAIRWAGRLLKSYPKSNPEGDNPSTTVHLLVKSLIGNEAP